MKRSEAMDKLPIEVTCDTVEFMVNHGSRLSMRCLDRDGNTVHHSVVEDYYSRLVFAARDLLNAEEDLPWEVKLHSSPSGQGYYPNVLVARCNSEQAAMHAAKLWGVQYATISCTVQTVCDDEDEPTESKYDPAFEGDPSECKFSDEFKAKLASGFGSRCHELPRLVPVTEHIVEVDGKYYRIEP